MAYDLNSARVFVEVVNAGSFVEAARRLRVPTSTVSDRIAALETALGTPLLVRTTRSMKLTEAGSSLFNKSAPLLKDLSDAFEAASDTTSSPTGSIRISAPMEFAYNEFAQAIARYRKQFPRVEVELIFTNVVLDLHKDRIDLALRGGVLKDTSLLAKRLGWGTQILLASEEFVRIHGSPKHPSDLKDFPCIAYASSMRPQSDGTWLMQNGKGRTVKAQPNIIARSNSFDAIMALVRSHQGIAYVPQHLGRPLPGITTPQPILPQWSVGRVPLNLVYAKASSRLLKIKRMIDLIEDELAPILERS